ncbi:hypothetical protein [Rhodococcus marinonascens]|uniref:hypothetical protein n=1 Tax=Rhodococcus marinonascens TaxID=38311 RepID=UPI000933E041|nr:hypothetical protein [Rhodococcus marinonascens]
MTGWTRQARLAWLLSGLGLGLSVLNVAVAAVGGRSLTWPLILGAVVLVLVGVNARLLIRDRNRAEPPS